MRTSPVGSFPPNGYGLYDMAGNLWEWCWDWFSDTYYAESPAADPLGPTTGSNRVLRGGAFNESGYHNRVARRYGDYFFGPGGHATTVGFRLVRNAP